METITKNQLVAALKIYHQEYIDSPELFNDKTLNPDEAAINQAEYIFNLIESNKIK